MNHPTFKPTFDLIPLLSCLVPSRFFGGEGEGEGDGKAKRTGEQSTMGRD